MIQRRAMLVLVIAPLVFWSCTSSVDGEDKSQPAATPAVEQPANAGGTDDVSTSVGRKGEGLVGEGSHELDTVVLLMRENLLVLGLHFQHHRLHGERAAGTARRERICDAHHGSTPRSLARPCMATRA